MTRQLTFSPSPRIGTPVAAGRVFGGTLFSLAIVAGLRYGLAVDPPQGASAPKTGIIRKSDVPITSSTTTPAPHEPPRDLVPFDIRDDQQVALFRALCQTLKSQAAEIMERHKNGEPVEESEFRNAAGGLYYVNRRPWAKLLADEVDKRPRGAIAAMEPGPLVGFLRAQALVRMGDREAAEATIESLRGERTRKQLLVRASVLRGLHDAEVIQERLRLALEQPAGDGDEERQFRSNVEQVSRWLQTPDYFRDRSNWPSRIHDEASPTLDEPPARKPEAPLGELSSDEFDIHNRAHRAYFGRLARSAAFHSSEVLRLRSQSKLPDEKLALRAATLLSDAPMRDFKVIDGLFDNLTLRNETENEPTGPLDGFPAARALAALGGREIRDRLLDQSLWGDFSDGENQFRLELLLRAHILHRIERLEILRFLATGQGRSHQIKEWFEAPGFFEYQVNWPSRLPRE